MAGLSRTRTCIWRANVAVCRLYLRFLDTVVEMSSWVFQDAYLVVDVLHISAVPTAWLIDVAHEHLPVSREAHNPQRVTFSSIMTSCAIIA